MLHAARFAVFAALSILALHAEPALVVYLDGDIPNSATYKEMVSEFRSLTLPYGIDTEWRNFTERTNSGQSGRLIVVRLAGNCAPDATERPAVTGEPLASVQEVDGRILPFVDLRCEALASLLRPALKNETAVSQKALFGRALGRVLAHEAYHILGQSHDHTADGVTRARLTSAELTRREARWDGTLVNAGTGSSFDSVSASGR